MKGFRCALVVPSVYCSLFATQNKNEKKTWNSFRILFCLLKSLGKVDFVMDQKLVLSVSAHGRGTQRTVFLQ